MNPYRKKISFNVKTTLVFLIIAAAIHLPLLRQWHPKRPIPVTFKWTPEATPVELEPRVRQVSAEESLWSDPTVYALPSDVGFSSSLRNDVVTPKLSAENPLPPAVMQPFEIATGEGDFNGVRTLAWASGAVSGPAEEEKPAEAPAASFPEGSSWRVVGAIADRNHSAVSALPVILYSEPLEPTVLRLGVGPRGDVMFALVQEGSGLDKADEAAVRFAKGMRFAPEAAAFEYSLTWGFLKINWRVESPRDEL